MSDTQKPGWRWPAGSGPQIAHAVFISLFAVSHFIVGFVLVGPLLGVGDDPFDGSLPAIAMTAVQGVYGWGLVIGAGVLLVNRVHLRDLDWRFDAVPLNLALGLAGAVALLCLTFGPLLVLGRIELGETLDTIRGFTGGQRAQIFLIGLLAASLEETLFRGYLQKGLVERLGFPVGLVIGAVVFGLYHLPMGIPVPMILGKIASGLVLGALKGRDRSLLAPMIAHFVFWQIAGFA